MISDAEERLSLAAFPVKSSSWSLSDEAGSGTVSSLGSCTRFSVCFLDGDICDKRSGTGAVLEIGAICSITSSLSEKLWTLLGARWELRRWRLEGLSEASKFEACPGRDDASSIAVSKSFGAFNFFPRARNGPLCFELCDIRSTGLFENCYGAIVRPREYKDGRYKALIATYLSRFRLLRRSNGLPRYNWHATVLLSVEQIRTGISPNLYQIMVKTYT